MYQPLEKNLVLNSPFASTQTLCISGQKTLNLGFGAMSFQRSCWRFPLFWPFPNYVPASSNPGAGQRFVARLADLGPVVVEIQIYLWRHWKSLGKHGLYHVFTVIYGDLGDGLSLFHPHHIMIVSCFTHITSFSLGFPSNCQWKGSTAAICQFGITGHLHLCQGFVRLLHPQFSQNDDGDISR